jgi:hypothetical protein
MSLACCGVWEQPALFSKPDVLVALDGLCTAVHFSILFATWRRFHYTMLAWLPTYFTDTLSLNLSQAAQVQLMLCKSFPAEATLMAVIASRQARHTVLILSMIGVACAADCGAGGIRHCRPCSGRTD